MLLIVGKFRVPVQKLPEARPVIKRMIEASRAEDGCFQYDFSEDLLDPGLIHVTELWRDGAVLERHGASDHMAAWQQAAGGFDLSELNLSLYEVGEPRRL